MLVVNTPSSHPSLCRAVWFPEVRSRSVRKAGKTPEANCAGSQRGPGMCGLEGLLPLPQWGVWPLTFFQASRTLRECVSSLAGASSKAYRILCAARSSLSQAISSRLLHGLGPICFLSPSFTSSALRSFQFLLHQQFCT